MCDSDDDMAIVGETRAAAEDPTSADDRAAKRPRGGQDLGTDLCNNDAPSCRPSIAEMKRALDAAGISYAGMERREMETEFKRVGSTSFTDPPLFRLFTTDHHDLTANSTGNAGCATLRDVVSGPVRWCVVMNFMIDLPWLLSPDGCPELGDVPRVVWIVDERSTDTGEIHRTKGANRDWTVVNPPVPKFGTHHTKCFVLVYDTGCRVCVHTANLIHGDVHKRTNAMWCQDFPLKSLNDLKTCAAESEFEHDLTRYLGALGWKDTSCVVPGMGNGQAVTVGPSAMRRFDFRGAGAKLVASIPGRWKGGDMNCWGHTAVRRALGKRSFPVRFANAPIVCQFTSIGKTTEKWLGEIAESFGAGKIESSGTDKADDKADDKATENTNTFFQRASDVARRQLGTGALKLVWPTMGEVRDSNLGYATGGSIPGTVDKITCDHVRSRLHRWRPPIGRGSERPLPAVTDPAGRGKVMPHVKTFARLAKESNDLAWVIVGSHNLSGAAWGRLEKNGSQIAILSYELGVLLTPQMIGPRKEVPFTCTPGAVSYHREAVPRCLCLANVRPACASDGPEKKNKFRVVATAGPAETAGETAGADVVRAPLPYHVPPAAYASSDKPWAIDGHDETADKYGRVMRGGMVDRFGAFG